MVTVDTVDTAASVVATGSQSRSVARRGRESTMPRQGAAGVDTTVDTTAAVDGTVEDGTDAATVIGRSALAITSRPSLARRDERRDRRLNCIVLITYIKKDIHLTLCYRISSLVRQAVYTFTLVSRFRQPFRHQQHQHCEQMSSWLLGLKRALPLH